MAPIQPGLLNIALSRSACHPTNRQAPRERTPPFKPHGARRYALLELLPILERRQAKQPSVPLVRQFDIMPARPHDGNRRIGHLIPSASVVFDEERTSIALLLGALARLAAKALCQAEGSFQTGSSKPCDRAVSTFIKRGLVTCQSQQLGWIRRASLFGCVPSARFWLV